MRVSNQSVNTAIRSGAALLAHLPRALGLVWAAAPGWTTAWAGLLLAQGLLPVAVVALTRPLVDALAAAITSGAGWDQLRPALLPLGLMAAALLLTGLLQSVMSWVHTVQAELVANHISARIHAKSAEVDLAFYESAEYYDQLHRARDEAASKPLALLESLGGLAQSAVTLAGMGVILLPYGLWVPLALIASTLPAFYIVYRYNRQYHAWWARRTPDRRRAAYYDWLLNDGYSAPELRIFNLSGHFQSAFAAIKASLLGERERMLRGQMLAQALSGLLALGVSAAALLWMIWRAVQGAFTLGDLALFYQAFDRGQGLMRAMLSSVGQIYASSLFLSHLFAYLDLRPTIADPPAPEPVPAQLRQGIRFRDITFRYPGSERPTLEGFNLELPAGRLTAIVGSNGAGKSTLIKLLCRFYDPEAGAVEVDGVDVRRLGLRDLRRLVTVLFQFPTMFQASAAENIGLSDRERAPGPEAVEAAARGAGAHELIARLPHGYATHLGKWFADGAELSGGEWQRVALARAFLRRSPVMVLDEPTSFMDVWAEAEWLDRFRQLTAGRTALIITHRFTTAMRADRILVMERGRIVEAGTHEELLANGGPYAVAWAAQMRDPRPPEALAARVVSAWAAPEEVRP